MTLAEDGDEIWVANGTYAPTTGTDRTISFELLVGVNIYGGFAGNETALAQRDIFANPTILSGAIGGGNFSYHVVKVASIAAPILNGFTIANSKADGGGSYQFLGGGVILFGDVAVVNCTFEDNFAEEQGGAVYIDHIDDEFAIFSNCVFRNNDAIGDGNETGGAVAIAAEAGFLFTGTASFINCLFHDNYARVNGAAIWQGHTNLTALKNCTLTRNNTAGSPGASTVYLQVGSKLSMKNTILWGNGQQPPDVLDDGPALVTSGTMASGAITITYSDLQEKSDNQPDGWFFDTTVVDIPPGFVDPATNFRLDGDSPLINVGGSISIPDTYDVDDDGAAGEPTPDLDLKLRIAECFIDLGAYEDRPAASCDFDLNDDGEVDGYDLAILLADWGDCPTSGACPADFNCDRVVDGEDLALLLGGWTLDEDYPRSCDSGESAMGGGSEPDTEALDEVLAALGLEDHDEFIVWLQLVGIDFAAAEIEQILSE